MDLTLDETLSDVVGQDGSGLLARDGQALPARFHPLAQLFPMIEGEAFAALVEDVRLNGVRRPVVMFEDMILDGRNRYMAAREAGVGFPVSEFTGPDPVAFVVSENIHRRHLTESQRAIVSGRLASLPQGRRADKAADLPVSVGVTQAQAADMLNVSERSVRAARSVIDRGSPGLVEMVEQDQASVSAAAQVAKLPEDLQAEVIAAGPDAVRDTAKAIRADATVVEKFDAGDPETVAKVREQICDVINGNAKPKGRANPIYEPSEAWDAATAVSDCANEIADTVAKHGPEILEAFPNNLARARAIAKLLRGRDAINTILGDAA